MSVAVTWRCDYCGKTEIITHHREPPKTWKMVNQTARQIQAFAKSRNWIFCSEECCGSWELAIHSAYLQAQNVFFGAIRAHQIQARGSAIDSLADLCDDVTTETFVPLKYDPPMKVHDYQESDLPF